MPGRKGNTMPNLHTVRPAAPGPCPLAAKNCGGCPLSGLAYPEQLALKQKNTEALLAKFGPVAPILGAEQPWGYRNKAVATFAQGPRGKLVCGTYAAGSHRVLPAVDCPLLAPRLNQTLAAALAAANACRWPAYDEDTGEGLVRHLVLRYARAADAVLVTVVTGQPVLPGSRNFVAALRKSAPWVRSVVQNYNPRATSAVLDAGPRAEKVLFGPGSVTDTLCGRTFTLSSRSFYQVNPAQTERLYAAALAAAGLTGAETVLDAYCGIGTIGLCAAGRAKTVVGVERSRDAVANAVQNARRNGIANARFFCADATAWMAGAAAEHFSPDVVFLDPPREGSTPDCIRAVAAMRPARVVYVSCNPATLARDLVLFAAAGYRAAGFQPVDMFPQTEHVETVVLMSRVDGK